MREREPGGTLRRQKEDTALITKITGKLLDLRDDALTLGVDAFEYEVLVPEFTRRQLQQEVGNQISLYIIHYLDGNPAHGRMTPRLIGFLTEVEREFFELFCSVDGVGIKKALRAMVRPVSDIATAIEEQDLESLSSLPGIGSATAERIVAKLRRKVPKFALMVTRQVQYAADVAPDVVSETYEVLRKLGHTESDARRLLDAVLATKRKFKDVQSLIAAIYQQSRGRTPDEG